MDRYYDRDYDRWGRGRSREDDGRGPGRERAPGRYEGRYREENRRGYGRPRMYGGDFDEGFGWARRYHGDGYGEQAMGGALFLGREVKEKNRFHTRVC